MFSKSHLASFQRPRKLEPPGNFGTCRQCLVLVPYLACCTIFIDCCQGQTTRVQLPTYERFGVSTTVVVPDGGALYLGGVNRSSRGASHFATPPGGAFPVFGNRGFGRATSAEGVSISATIIDHREIDRALLAEAARRRGAKYDVLGRAVENAPQLSPLTAGTRGTSTRAARSYLPKNLSRNIRGSVAATEAVRD
ncbi:MAG: hypothetical protein MI725_13525 [Pirellulales bacterium]|nr:hypothetical protein [Pirellulales bacterium]